MQLSPFSKSVERLVASFSYNSNLTAADSVYKTTAFDDGFRSNQYEVHLVHHICNRRV